MAVASGVLHGCWRLAQLPLLTSLKKESTLISVNQRLLEQLSPSNVEVVICRADAAEMDEMWSYVKRKREPRWLWHAIDHRRGKVLAYVFGRRQAEVFLKLQALLLKTDTWYLKSLANQQVSRR
jgi:hypothetical protein